jgi:exo-beta-1,3-glucanase (GH17 family)
VFEEPVQLEDIPSRVEQVLRDLRIRDLVSAGIPASVPIRVTENGWPTGTNPLTNTAPTCERQAEVIDTVVHSVHELRRELNISHYMLFGLRDADSAKPDLFHRYGILRDDYSAKPAYGTFRRLINELGP